MNCYFCKSQIDSYHYCNSCSNAINGIAVYSTPGYGAEIFIYLANSLFNYKFIYYFYNNSTHLYKCEDEFMDRWTKIYKINADIVTPNNAKLKLKTILTYG